MGVAYVGGASSYDCHELLVIHSLLFSFQELQVLLIVLNGSLVPQESHQSYTAPEIWFFEEMCQRKQVWRADNVRTLSLPLFSLSLPPLSLSLCLIQYILLFFTVLSQLKVTRQRLLELFNNHANSVEDLTVAFTEYVGLLKGLVDAPNGGDSKLRTLTLFKWTNSLGGRVPR